MPGPALNAIANTAPVAPAKAATGTRPDAPEAAGGPGAPEQGFASELKRQMRGDAPPEDGAEARAGAGDESAEAARAADEAAAQAAQLPPELAAMLAASAAPPAPAAPRTETPAADASALAGGSSREGGKLADLAAALSGETANSAANPGPLAADAAPGPAPGDVAKTLLAEAGSGTHAETGADAAAQPTNNFAAIHAAALANLRGESTQPAAAPVPLHVATPAGAPGWPEEVGNRVSWMVGHTESHAELTLTPPQLGKIEVSITIAGDQTTAQIVAASAAARDLIEQSLPRLREVLQQSGINLGQTDVGTSGQPGNSGEGRRGSNGNGTGGTPDGGIGAAGSSAWVRRAEGLVDTFA